MGKSPTACARFRAVAPLRRIAAGPGTPAAVMAVYARGEGGSGLAWKDDRTPLTEADLASHRVIIDGLQDIAPAVPVVSEEDTEVGGRERGQAGDLWLGSSHGAGRGDGAMAVGGVARRMTLTWPGCSTTKRRAGSPGGAVRWTGEERPPRPAREPDQAGERAPRPIPWSTRRGAAPGGRPGGEDRIPWRDRDHSSGPGSSRFRSSSIGSWRLRFLSRAAASPRSGSARWALQ
jgi:hypothetical protein